MIDNHKIVDADDTIFESPPKMGKLKLLQNSLKKLGQNLYSRLAKFIPFTQQYRSHYTSLLLVKSRKRLFAFREIKTLNSKTKKGLIAKIRRYQIVLANIELKSNMFEKPFISSLAIILMLVALFGVPQYAAKLLGTDFSFWAYLGIFFANWGYYLLLILLASLPFSLPKSWQLNVSTTVSLLWIVTALVGYTVISYQLAQHGYINFGQYITLSAMLSVLVYFYPLIIIFIPVEIFIWRWTQSKRTTYANFIIVDRLTTLLYLAEQESKHWSRLSHKRRMMSEIETVALFFESKLPTQLRSNDKVTDYWFRNTATQVAASFRSLKKWVLTPKTNTRQQLVDKIAHNLLCVINGSWDELDRTQPEYFSNAKISLSQWKSSIGSLLTGIIPLLLLIIIQNTPLAVKGDVADYLTAGIVIWSALSFLSMIDPLYSDKISNLKNLASLLFGINKNNQP